MYTVFTPGGKDAVGVVRSPQIVAVFDTLGNGVVFNEDNEIRLSYNQNGGVCTDNPRGSRPIIWSWSTICRNLVVESVYAEPPTVHLENDLLATISTKSSKGQKTPASMKSDAKAGKDKEVEEITDEASREDSDVEGNLRADLLAPIARICLRINHFLSLRILDRRNINLQFFAGNRSIRIELGTELNYQKELLSYYVDSSQWEAELLKCRYQKRQDKIGSESSLYEIRKECQKSRNIAKRRNRLIEKYRTRMGCN
ncbi:uncharacterized protein LOC105696779 [Orussus abietinus]|uniref:uncharacterized protein LOC105696779 n=1 Tax=Orussus abietinus TaxID=222816 RepID=UPI00062526B4|nr:uncharacterized protein LOC105696779 [Orussus abietinus]